MQEVQDRRSNKRLPNGRMLHEYANTYINARNAASSARFSPASTGLALIDRERVFAQYWTHPGDDIESDNHKQIMCAEVLVPSRLPSHYIFGAYVSCKESQIRLNGIAPQLPLTVNAHLFF